MRLSIGSELHAGVLLFDMDGTLVSSIAAVERVWRRWAAARGLDDDAVLAACHGRRLVETVRDFLPPGADHEAEARGLEAAEMKERDGIFALPGAAALLQALPPGRWAIVTSAHRELAEVRLGLAGLPIPEVLIAAGDVTAGKPDPEGFATAAARLGAGAAGAIVFEDAPAGLAAGKAAGFRTIALATTLPPEQLDGWEWIPDMSVLTLDAAHPDGALRLSVRG